MLWKIRIRLADRPGTLAELARECGESGVNILAMQVFPGIESVTDELVVRLPESWGADEVCDLVARAGASFVGANPCNEGALADQPTRHVQAARTILAEPARFPEVVARLFDAEPELALGTQGDVMEMVVGDVVVQVHRTAPFTATEHARGAAIAELVGDVLASRAGIVPSYSGNGRMGTGVDPQLVVGSHEVRAVVEGVTVARALLGDRGPLGDRRLVLEVGIAWRRRGVGTRLLVEAARLASGLGDDELVITTRADNQAVLPMVLGSGMRGRIKMSGDELVVRVPLRDLAPADRV